MPVIAALLCALSILSRPVWADEQPIVDIQTNYGTITVQLNPDKAPITVGNFLRYVNEDFYSNTLFHRVIAGFMVQGGGFNLDGTQKQAHAPIKLESNNGLSHLRGTIAMARTNVADSATSQFFINSVDNGFLNYQQANNLGYAVFGKVIEGLSVVDRISGVKTNKDAPVQPVTIEAARVRAAQLHFGALQTAYHAGDTLTIILQENTITRQQALDLWVAIKLPNGEFEFIGADKQFSAQPQAFKWNVDTATTIHPVVTLTVPVGSEGVYTLYAIFNKPDQGIQDLSHSLQSNLATAPLVVH